MTGTLDVPAARGGGSGRPRVMLMVDRLDDQQAGAERTAYTLGLMLGDEGFDVHFCTTRLGRGRVLDELAARGVRQLHLQRGSRRLDHRALERLYRHLRDERIDVVHAHMFGSNVWATAFGRAARVPVVVAHEHSWPYEGQPARRLVDAVIGRAADAFVAVSRADAALMTSYEWVPPRKIHVIPSAWTPRPPAPLRDVRALHGIPRDAPVVGTVAVLRRVKRLELLVEAFARVLRDAPDAWLLIGGGGPDRSAVEQAIQDFGVGARAVITGYVEDVDSVWDAVDVAAMCSDREGTPVAALEAMNHGVPMVAPAVGGIPDVFEHGGGVLVPRHDVDALARELLALVRDPGRRAAIGATGRDRAKHYTAERQVQRCAALYRELLASPAAQGRLRRRDRRVPARAA